MSILHASIILAGLRTLRTLRGSFVMLTDYVSSSEMERLSKYFRLK